MEIGALRGLAYVLASSGDVVAGRIVHMAVDRIVQLEAENARLRKRPAPGIEAAPADMTRSGMAEGKSPVGKAEAP